MSGRWKKSFNQRTADSIQRTEQQRINMKRPLFHFMGGLIFPVFYYFTGRDTAIYFIAGLFSLVLIFELIRSRTQVFNDWLWQYFRAFFKDKERYTMTGTPYFVGGALATVLFFDKPIAITALCFLTFGDVTAVLVGKKYGKHKIFSPKSLEGSLAFLVMVTMVGFILKKFCFPSVLTPRAIWYSALTATLIEMLPISLDDNLTVPIVTGFILQMLV
jgi:dolichol kinase